MSHSFYGNNMLLLWQAAVYTYVSFLYSFQADYFAFIYFCTRDAINNIVKCLLPGCDIFVGRHNMKRSLIGGHIQKWWCPRGGKYRLFMYHIRPVVSNADSMTRCVCAIIGIVKKHINAAHSYHIYKVYYYKCVLLNHCEIDIGE